MRAGSGLGSSPPAVAGWDLSSPVLPQPESASSLWSRVCLPAEPQGSWEPRGWESCVLLPELWSCGRVPLTWPLAAGAFLTMSLPPGQPVRALGEVISPTPTCGPPFSQPHCVLPQTRCMGTRPAQALGGQGPDREGLPRTPTAWPTPACVQGAGPPGSLPSPPPICAVCVPAIWGHPCSPPGGGPSLQKMLPH